MQGRLRAQEGYELCCAERGGALRGEARQCKGAFGRVTERNELWND